MVIIMKKYNRIIVQLTAAVILLQTAASAANDITRQYYQYIPEQGVDYTILEYNEAFDTSVFYTALEKVRAAMAVPNNKEAVKAMLDEAYKELLKSSDKYYMAMLKCDKSFNEENNNAVQEEFNKNSDIFEAFTILLQDMFNSEYVNILFEIIGEDLTLEELLNYVNDIPTSETMQLEQQENALISQYNSIYGDAEKSAEIFLELLKTRKKIATAEGYDNYADYANEVIYGREYTNEEITEFQNAVAEYISPYFENAVSAYYLSNMAVPEADMTEVRDKIGAVMGKINPELKWAYDYMISNKLYSFEYSTEKNQSVTGYTVSFPYLNIPYILINPCSDYGEEYISTATTIIHEFGHFAAALHDPLNSNPYSALIEPVSIDTCEIESQGLEVLAEKYFGELFGKGASGARYSEILMRIAAILDGCIYNEWETRVYQLENPTAEELNRTAAEIMSKYYGTETDEQSAMEAWTSVSHLFRSPMYYISYAVSSAAACELYAIASKDYDSAVDKYMTLSAMGESIPFWEALEGCGMENVLQRDAVKGIADVIGETYAWGYNDISSDAWYYPYILYTSHIFEPADSSHFEPDVNITRRDFVELLGKSEEYYSGMDDEYNLIFKDVDPNSDDAKYIAWAYGSGIISGVSDTEFDGDAQITREQLVAVMHRYAAYKKFDTEPDNSSELSFNDEAEISDWAKSSVVWAVQEGIINGRDNNILDPKGNATRAESAKIITMFIENY